MDDLTATALNAMIHKQFETWKNNDAFMDEIVETMCRGCKEEDSRDEVFIRMIYNSMEVAACVSAQIIMEILVTAGVVKPADEEQLRRNVLSVVK